ncbi:MAG: hypothetical protein IT559_04365 [Alphaproteobacteria bacterium]|nr:hypothetical protein [Alphaproteobacteria bacterium]
MENNFYNQQRRLAMAWSKAILIAVLAVSGACTREEEPETDGQVTEPRILHITPEKVGPENETL